MKKIVVLSCSIGQGHNSCAQAIKEYFNDEDVSCEIRDSLDFISRRFSRFISWGHSFIYRYIPGLFRWGYRYVKEHPEFLGPNSVIYRILTTGSGALHHYLLVGEFDVVICTHVFASIIF